MFAVTCSWAPPLLEACSNGVLGLCPVAQWRRDVSETRPIKRVAIACPQDDLFNKAEEELEDSELLVVNEMKSTHLVKAPIICDIIYFLNIVQNCSYSFSFLHTVVFHNSFVHCLYLSL